MISYICVWHIDLECIPLSVYSPTHMLFAKGKRQYDAMRGIDLIWASTHQLHWLFNRLFSLTPEKSSKPCITDKCPREGVINAENDTIPWSLPSFMQIYLCIIMIEIFVEKLVHTIMYFKALIVTHTVPTSYRNRNLLSLCLQTPFNVTALCHQ